MQEGASYQHPLMDAAQIEAYNAHHRSTIAQVQVCARGDCTVVNAKVGDSSIAVAGSQDWETRVIELGEEGL
jgi:hypothetical protein